MKEPVVMPKLSITILALLLALVTAAPTLLAALEW